ncbi:3-phosphoserine/phosphohydroxythreonine transaminase [Leptospira langatensis]|uniref:Phosphoserine aminotransferase n=1 Tax=Leptospira langatensis TaxID=2484983 RepID=A0A5F1ZUH6_9LEPT|nr:3-phosphoserine/phosphohydroxythreonine transaminase [Leptospira langatensis]TGK01437.1 3-phosphoserine/phosphohydroxythreonine transaminase [Leptospira langatensis]TGL42113.1 3-phosphoserine/phosphohydroxythreonine transaminase [Leptospira langatensis]
MSEFERRIYNFYGGPAMLPTPVMEKAASEFLNYRRSGMSIMEVSHRGKLFEKVLDESLALLRELLSVPENYEIMFLSAGASLHFSALPLNLLHEGESADFAITGIWAKKAMEEALRFNPVKKIYDGEDHKYTEVPELDDSMVNPGAAYVYITSNNTLLGSRYPKFPKLTKAPLIADMTSEILSRKIDISQFGAIFAGAQKNIGPSGLSVLIIRKDLLGRSKRTIPVLMDYALTAKNKSMYNTPPTYSIYMSKLVFEWLKEKGGIDAIEKINEEKAKLLYDYLDTTSFYQAAVKPSSRSVMNVVFTLQDKNLESKFLAGAEEKGLVGLEGHRLVGGLRASIYNAMPREGVVALIDYMKEFEKKA